MNPFLQTAINEAIPGRDEGGIPIGAALVIDDQIVGRGHNRRVQRGSAILHAEMDYLFSCHGPKRATEFSQYAFGGIAS